MGEARAKKRREAREAEQAKRATVPSVAFVDLSPFFVPADLMQSINVHYENFKVSGPGHGLYGLREFVNLLLADVVGRLDQQMVQAQLREQEEAEGAPEPARRSAMDVAIEASKRIRAMKEAKDGAVPDGNVPGSAEPSVAALDAGNGLTGVGGSLSPDGPSGDDPRAQGS